MPSSSSPDLMRRQLAAQVAIIGAGPAGLMAAEALTASGLLVDVYDAMPSVGRKFLQAGVGGLNITHSEDYRVFCARYGERRTQLQAMLDLLPPDALRAWAHGLGVETFVGSSGRVFPAKMKAAPLLRAWLQRLRSAGIRLHVRHRWQGWHADGALKFLTAAGEISIRPQATVLALGGGSWPQLGSDGAWVSWLEEKGIIVAPLQSANCGFDVAWSQYLRDKYAGTPLKAVALTFTDLQGHCQQRQGEMLISNHGVEGSLIYGFSAQIRQCLDRHGQATFFLDLAPGRDVDRVAADIALPRGSRSLSGHLQSRVGLSPVKVALLRELLDKAAFADHSRLAAAIKSLPVTVSATRPVTEAISSAGGVCFSGLDRNLMLNALPGTFVAGEMLDWEAPTGGYLLTACFATGWCAGLGVLEWLGSQSDI